MRALILAAGVGKRLRPLTYLLPKPMLSVGGVPMLVRQIRALRKAGIRHIVINTAYGSQVLEALVRPWVPDDTYVYFSREGVDISTALETLGGIVKALPLLTQGEEAEEAFLVVAGDIVTDYDYAKLIAQARHLNVQSHQAHLVLVPNPTYNPKGDMGLTADGQHVSRETKTHTFSSLGAYHSSLFKDEKPVFKKLFPWLFDVADGRITGEVYEGLWLNVGDPNEYLKADKHMSECAEAEEERVNHA